MAMAVGCRSKHVRYGTAHFPAALLVGRRSRCERRVVKPALSTCRSTFRRFVLEGASAAAPSFCLCLRSPPLRISGLALRDTCGECWGSSGGLGGAWRASGRGRGRGRRRRRRCGREFSWVASDVSGGGRWPSSGVLGERGSAVWFSTPVLCIWRN
jgi:hypothetical protein